MGGKKAKKAGALVSPTEEIKVAGEPFPYVSRGGLKLAHAFNFFRLDLQGKIVCDVGAGTGGFTDCALQRGAKKVYAVDVGYGQLAWKLRCDPRVVVLERQNARFLSPTQIPEPVDLATIDASFISLTKIIPALVPLLGPQGEVIALIKPQFEAGREKVGRKGVVREPEVQVEVILKVAASFEACGLKARGLTFSPLRGPGGNLEFLLWASREGERVFLPVKEVVNRAHQTLG